MGERAEWAGTGRTGPRTKRITDAARPFATAISPIVFGRADKLSGIMPASQSINYEREREIGCTRSSAGCAHTSSYACLMRECERASGRSGPAATNTPAVYFIDHSVSRFQVLHEQVAASSQKPRAFSFFHVDVQSEV